MTTLYGKEGQAYPVVTGQVWRCGRHSFKCGDIHSLTPSGHHTLVYSDPPWNDGNLRSFHTKAGMAHPEYDWRDVYRAIIERSGGGVPLWLEGGLAQCEELVRLLPGPVTASWGITYYGTRPCVLVYSGQMPPPVINLAGCDDEETPGLVLSVYEPGLVLDPCAGRGLTARAAELAGWASMNNELNPLRVSAALARMAKLTGLPAERLA